jgi:hypothetical protein
LADAGWDGPATAIVRCADRVALPRAVSLGNGIPVDPDASADDDPSAEVVILPAIWLWADESIRGYDGLIE